MPFNHPSLVRIAPLLFVLLWSTGFIGAKYALPYIEPFYLLLIRMILTLIVFLALAMVLKSTWPTAQQAGHQMVVGFLIHACYLGGVFAAIKWNMPAGITAVIVGLQPLLSALLSWKFMGERLRAPQWIGLLLGLAGVSIIVISSQQHADFSLQGKALFAAIIALIGISLGTLYQKRFGQGIDLISGSFYQYFATAIAMAILAFVFEERVVEWSSTLMLALAWLVIGLSVSAILLLMLMIREGEVARVASYFYLVPAVTAVEAWLLFGENLSAIQGGAVAITVFGVFLVIRSPSKQQR